MTSKVPAAKKVNEEDAIISSKQLAIYLVPLAIVCAVIAWFRNSDKFVLVRLFYVMFAYVFNIFYLVYIVYRWFRVEKSEK